MKSPPLPRMLLQAWLRVEPKWSRKVSSAERNNCDVTAAPQARVLISNGEWPNSASTSSCSCPHFPFAFSPSSTRRRMASGRERSGSFCFVIQASIAADWSGRIRRCTDSAPVDGLPRVFLVRDIDLVINFMYQKSKPEGS
jgi:hypothetical protein